MALDVPIKLYGVVAIIMFFTYFAVGITSADEYINPAGGTDVGINTSAYVGDFVSWIDLQFIYAYDILISGNEEIKQYSYFNERTFIIIEDDYLASLWSADKADIFDRYGHTTGSGYSYFLSPYVQEDKDIWRWIFGGSEAEDIKAQYDEAIIPLYERDTPWWEAIVDFFGTLGSSFGKLMSLLTFTSIPSIEEPMTTILRVIFIPMWAILVIGIAPVVADFIKAIGGLIPFT